MATPHRFTTPIRRFAHEPSLMTIGSALLAGLLSACGDVVPDSYRFAFRADEPAVLWINGKEVGSLPRSFSGAEFENHFTSEYSEHASSFVAMEQASTLEFRQQLHGGSMGAHSQADRFKILHWSRAPSTERTVLVRAYFNTGHGIGVHAGGFRVSVKAKDGSALKLADVDATAEWSGATELQFDFTK